MNKLSLLLFLAVPAFGQWVVVDPTNQAVNLATQANEVAHHVEVLNQWAQNLEKLNAQLREVQNLLAVQRQVRDVLGDPAGAGSRLIVDKFGDTEFGRAYGETLRAVRRLEDAAASLRYTAEDTYAALDDRTSLGRPLTRDPARYRRYAAVERQAENLAGVQEETDERLKALQADLGATVAALRTASTQSEADKLRGVVGALNGQIAHLDAVRRDEADKLRALQILNENQAAKERQDLWEKQAAEERDSAAVINAWQRSVKLTPTSYER